jgi:hypothetical protein
MRDDLRGHQFLALLQPGVLRGPITPICWGSSPSASPPLVQRKIGVHQRIVNEPPGELPHDLRVSPPRARCAAAG